MKSIVIQKGTLETRLRYINSYLQSLSADKEYLIEVKLCQSVRRLAQNKLMWMWYGQLTNWYLEHFGLQKPPEFFKYYHQALFLGHEAIETYSGVECRLVGTSSLSVKQFAEFLEKVKLEIEANEEFTGLALKDPELYRYAVHGEKRAV